MKPFKKLFTLLVVFTTLQASAQTDKETTTRLINDQHFIFNATSAMPTANLEVNAVLNKMQPGGASGLIQLSGSQYQLKINKDSIEAYLPYYGRAYTASMNPDDSGIKFKSKNFGYKLDKKKKGGWVINIRPKDTKDISSLTLNVSESGYASLNVNSNNRQSISFNGVIAEPKEPKETKK